MVWIVLENYHEQRYVARIYFWLAAMLFFRPDVGTLLPYLESTLPIASSLNIAILFLILGVWFRKTKPIYTIFFGFLLLPLLFFSAYIVFFMLTNTNSSLVTSVFIVAAWYKIFGDLKQSVEVHDGPNHRAG